jgi:hypothetical protein
MYIKFKSENDIELMVSMKITAHEGEAHSIRKKLIKPCTTDLAACMINEKAAKKILLLSSSDYMIQRRIQDCTVKYIERISSKTEVN